MRFVCISFLSFLIVDAFAQVSAAFQFDSPNCKNQIVNFQNTSTGASTYIWDFCQDGLTQTSSIAQVSNLTLATPAISSAEGITLVTDQGNWFGFVCGRDNHKLYKLSFGNTLSNNPVVTSLGNIDSKLNGPSQITIIKDGSSWFGFVTNFYDSKLIRLNFGNSINNEAPTLTATDLGTFGAGSGPRGFDIAARGNKFLAIISYWNNELITLDFDNGLNNSPGSTHTISNASTYLSGALGISLIESGGVWYAVMVNYSNGKVLHLDFGTNPMNDPVFSLLTTQVGSTDVNLIRDGLNYYGFVETPGGLMRIDFHEGMGIDGTETINTPSAYNGALSGLFGLAFGKEGANWRALTVSQTSGLVHRINFTDVCGNTGVSVNTSNAPQPSDLSYSQAGTFYLELLAYDASGNVNSSGAPITIQNIQAPVIDFTTNNSCVTQQNTFTATTSDAALVSDWAWDFGDGFTDNTNNSIVSHQYSAIGAKNVTLSIVAQNGCNTSIQKSIAIFNPPTSSFTLPPLPNCTNQSLSFANTSSFDSGSGPQWKWLVNDVEVSSSQDLNYVFASSQASDIKLITSITGCSASSQQSLATLAVGPSVDFSYTNNCFGKPILFLNSTSGTGITSFTWNFDDGNSDVINTNPSHLFGTGMYNVKLTVDNDAGCSNTKTVAITVSDQSLADFTYTSPTENIPSTFTGTDLTLSDDAISDWKWSYATIEKAGNPKDLTFTNSGTIAVTLDVNTTQGCTFSVAKDVVVKTALRPTIDFSMVASACLQENIFIQNNTVNATSYLWDFCQDGLKQSALASLVTDLSEFDPSIVSPEGVDMANDAGNWIAFAFGRDNNTLYRIEFGASLSNSTLAIQSLGNIGGQFNLPTQIKLVLDNGKWYGFVTNFGNSKIIRINFGSSLSNNTPTVSTTNLGSMGAGVGPRAFDIIETGSGYSALISYWDNTLTAVNFANGIDQPPTSNYTISNSTGLLLNPIGVALLKDNGKLYALVSNYSSGKTYHLDFGTDLLSNPIFSLLTTTPFSTDVALMKDGLNIYGFIETINGLVRVDFKENLSLDGSETISPPNNYSNKLGDLFGLSFAKEGANWRALTISQASKKIHLISFEDICNGLGSIKTSTAMVPSGLTFSQPGNYFVELTAFKAGAMSSYIGKPITVQNLTSPSIDFSTQNACISKPNEFNAINSSASEVSTYAWTFGDNTNDNSNSPTVSHQYSTTGTNNVSLSVIAQNGCHNEIRKPVSIFNPPSASFTLPSNPHCTNQLYTFNNTSSVDAGSNPSWQWLVDNQPLTTAKDLQYAFANTTDASVKLIASIPGCTSTSEQQMTSLIAGPLVDFSVNGKCDKAEIQFTSSISEAVNSLSWNFGDGNTSGNTNPKIVYAGPAKYDVTLSTISPSGCNNSKTKTITIYNNPQPDFSVDGPPNSCTGVSTKFTNSTPALTDSEISSWLWIFNPGLANSSTIKSPTYSYSTAGDYNISLKATTDQGCSSTIQKTIPILQGPTAVIGNTPSCVGLPINFSATGTSLDAFYWEMGASYYTTSNPTHTFNLPGNYNTKLTITASNKCQLTTSKVIVVPVVLIPDFSIAKNCVGYDAVFTDVTRGSDPVIQHDWEIAGLPSKSGSPVNFNFSAVESKTVKLTIKAQSNCTYSKTKSFNIVPAPQAGFDVDATSGAVPLVSRFTNTSSNATLYHWSFGDEDNESTEASPSFTFQNPGEFVITLAASNPEGCISTATKAITAQTPVPDVEIKLISYSTNPDGSLKVIITLQNNGNTILQNLPVDIDVSGITAFRETVVGPIKPATLYNLVLGSSFTVPDKLNFFCASTSLSDDIDPGNNKLCKELEGKISILSSYPNPVQSILYINWISPESETVNVRIVDTFGKVQLDTNIISNSGLNEFTWNVEHVESGLYIVSLKTGSILKTERIAINH